MKSDDVRILQGVQRNAGMAMKAISALESKVYDDDLAVQMTRQSMRYSEIYNKAADRLLQGKALGYQDSALADMRLKGEILGNTLFNTSTSRIAELMIQKSSRGLTDMWKTMNHHENAGNISLEIAGELVDFEEKNMERMKKYL